MVSATLKPHKITLNYAIDSDFLFFQKLYLLFIYLKKKAEQDINFLPFSTDGPLWGATPLLSCSGVLRNIARQQRKDNEL